MGYAGAPAVASQNRNSLADCTAAKGESESVDLRESRKLNHFVVRNS